MYSAKDGNVPLRYWLDLINRTICVFIILRCLLLIVLCPYIYQTSILLQFAAIRFTEFINTSSSCSECSCTHFTMCFHIKKQLSILMYLRIFLLRLVYMVNALPHIFLFLKLDFVRRRHDHHDFLTISYSPKNQAKIYTE